MKKKRLNQLCGMAIMVILSLLLITNCVQSAAEDDDDDDTSHTGAIPPSVLMTKLSTLELNLPETLKEQDEQSSSSTSRANIDYAGLNEVNSQAYSQLLMNLDELQNEVETLDTVLLLFDTQIDNSLAENTLFETSYIEYDDYDDVTYDVYIKGKYEYGTAGSDSYILLKAGLYWDEEYLDLFGSFYIEAKELANDEISGQANYIYEDEDETGDTYSYKSKIVFNTATDVQDAYFNYNFPGYQGSGMIRITPDTNDTNNGVYIATYFDTAQWGKYLDLGWANDLYGGLKSYSEDDWDDDGTTDQELYSEYFALDNSDAKIIYRKWGSLDPTDIYWHADEARDNIADLSTVYALNAYDDTITTIPTALTMAAVFDAADTLTSVKVYNGSYDSTTIGTATELTTADSLAAIDPYDIWYIAWLPGTGTDILPGDSIYIFSSYDELDNGDGTYTEIAIYDKALEVPQPVTNFGVSGFYVEEMFPLKYVTGSSGVNTIIQYQQVDWNNDGILDPDEDYNNNDVSDDYIYYIDLNANASFDEYGKVGDGVTPEKELIVWQWDEEVWDETQQTSVSMPGTQWVFTDDPGALHESITYTFETQKTAIDGKLDLVDDNDYISTLSIPDFAVAADTWHSFTASDFIE